jgi:hypothetical protein
MLSTMLCISRMLCMVDVGCLDLSYAAYLSTRVTQSTQYNVHNQVHCQYRTPNIHIRL